MPEVPRTIAPADGVETLSALEVYEHLRCGTCTLIDLRGNDRAAGIIDGSVHVPAFEEDGTAFVAKVPEHVKQFAGHSFLVFTCQYSAHRAPTCANAYREVASPQQRVAILAGGFRAWEGIGLPVLAKNEAEGHAADDYAMSAGLRIAHGGATQGAQAHASSPGTPAHGVVPG